jgi:hypothetical protein
MSQRIVDVFEMILDPEKITAIDFLFRRAKRNRLRDPVVEQQPIRQIRNNVVLCGVRHLCRHRPRCTDIMENNNRSDDAAGPIADRRDGVFLWRTQRHLGTRGHNSQ